MPRNHQHPDAHHGYVYNDGLGKGAPARSAHDRELDAWLDRALGAKAADPAPSLREV